MGKYVKKIICVLLVILLVLGVLLFHFFSLIFAKLFSDSDLEDIGELIRNIWIEFFNWFEYAINQIIFLETILK